jgi:hypothetical protein
MLALAVHWGDVASCADDERKVANGSLAMLAAMGLFRVPSECLTVGSFLRALSTKRLRPRN